MEPLVEFCVLGALALISKEELGVEPRTLQGLIEALVCMALVMRCVVDLGVSENRGTLI